MRADSLDAVGDAIFTASDNDATITAQLRDSYRATLDESHRMLSCGQVRAGMTRLMNGLSALRSQCDPEQWDSMFQAEALPHPISQLVWQDPFTAHSFRKPRGYPGDAALLDYIYGQQPLPPTTTSLGAAIFRFNRNRQAPRSVRSRALILARAIDRTAARFARPRICSIACGHLREAAYSTAVKQGQIGEFIAVDQDPESLNQVERDWAQHRVKTDQASVRSILAGKVRFEEMHLIYAAGLLDYLSDRVATRLTECLFHMLASGGRLLVANFVPSLSDLGYIESFMDWKLIYRQPQQLAALANGLGGLHWSSHRLFWDAHRGIVFLQLTKSRRLAPTRTFSGVKAVVPGRQNITLAAPVLGGPGPRGPLPK